MAKLFLGEGPESRPGKNKVRVDVVPEWADVVCDLNETIPIPFVYGTLTDKYDARDTFFEELDGKKFDYIEAHHIFEHIESTRQLKRIMQWCYDILEDGGIFDITVPYWKSDSAVECIEHVRFFNENSFMNYYENPYSKEMGLPQFKKVVNELRPHGEHLEVHVQLTK